MPLIPKPRTPDKESIPLRIERALNAELREYAQFVDCTKDYVIDAALRRLFKHDKEFLAWRDQRRAKQDSGNGSGSESGPALSGSLSDSADHIGEGEATASDAATGRSARRIASKERS